MAYATSSSEEKACGMRSSPKIYVVTCAERPSAKRFCLLNVRAERVFEKWACAGRVFEKKAYVEIFERRPCVARTFGRMTREKTSAKMTRVEMTFVK